MHLIINLYVSKAQHIADLKPNTQVEITAKAPEMIQNVIQTSQRKLVLFWPINKYCMKKLISINNKEQNETKIFQIQKSFTFFS